MASTIKFRCLDNSGNNIFLIDSESGVFSTNTTDSTSATSGAVVLHGGLSIKSSTNATSITQGGTLTVAGGGSIQRDFYVGGDLITSGYITTGTLFADGITVGNLNFTGNLYQNGVLFEGGGGTVGTATGIFNTVTTQSLNLGISNYFSGSFAINNGTLVASNVTGFSVSSSTRSFTSTMTVSILRSSGGNLFEYINIDGHQTDSGWTTYITRTGDATGVVFTLTSGGQLQYTSTTQTDFISGTLRFTVNRISDTGTYSAMSETGGSYLIDYLQINSTTDAIAGISNGGLYVLGGATITKSLNAQTIIANTFTGGNLSLSGNITIAGTLTTVNITTTNLVGTNVSAGLLNTTTATIGSFVSTIASVGTVVSNTFTGGSISISGALTSITATIGSFVATTTSSGTVVANTFTGGSVSVSGTVTANTCTVESLVATTTSSGTVVANTFTGGSISIDGTVAIGSTENAIGGGWSTGSLTVAGGASIAKDLYIGGSVLQIPLGSTLDRPVNVSSGTIRYNTETSQFEGYGSGNWGSLGGTIDIAQTTKILASESPNVTDGNLYFYTVANERMRINSAGNIGIGTSSPAYTVDINGSLGISGDVVATSESNTIGNLFTANNNVGIGLVDPQYTLDVSGDLRVSADLYILGSINSASASTFSYLTLTATDASINLSTGSIFTLGGITIQTTADAISVTNGGGITVAGGVSIAKNLRVGTTVHTPNVISDTIVSTTGTLGNFVSTTATIGSIVCTTSSTGTAVATTFTGGAIGITGAATANSIAAVTGTVGSFAATNSTITNIQTTNITVGALNVAGSFNISNSTIANLVVTSSSTATAIADTFTGGSVSVTGTVSANTGTVNRLNIGTSNTFTGSMLLGNNVSTLSNITGFVFDRTDVRSFTSHATVTVIRSSGGDLYETFNIIGHQSSTDWRLYIDRIGDASGVNFSITSSGQVQYTSSDIPNFVSNTFRFHVTEHHK